MTSAFRRAPRVPFRTDEKEPKVRLRGLRRPLRYPLEYLAIIRRLQPLPTGTPAEGSIQVAGAPNGRSRIARENPLGGKQRPYRAFARSARVRGEAAQFSASPWALRATQKRKCLPGRTSGTVPGILGQRHCARGAAAGGMLYTRPLIREPGAADFGRRPTGGGAGVAGIWPQAILIENPARRAGSAQRTQAGAAGRSARERPSRVARSGRSPGRPRRPPAASFPSFLGGQEIGPPAGAGPGSSAARRATTDKLRRSMSGKPKGSLSVDYRQAPPLGGKQIAAAKGGRFIAGCIDRAGVRGEGRRPSSVRRGYLRPPTFRSA